MDDKARKIIIYWLYSGCLLIFLMVVIGGITRLTGSGLSITEWKVVTGTFPPLNENQWQQEFYKYQQSPQYKLINSHFTLHDFKGIYWWEYLHRLTGRFIGIVFLIPFLFFLIKGWVDKKLLPGLLFIFFLGGLQGFLGWYMVASGLVDNPHVSHFRLALHLINAFITFAYTLWVALDLKYAVGDLHLTSERKNLPNANCQLLIKVLLCVLFFQIIYGAFVAGLKAGHIYNTWPMMGDEWIAESVTYAYAKDGISSLLYNLASVQFIHRTTAIILFLMAGYLWLKRKNKKWKLLQHQINALNTVLAVVIMQFLLGVLTLLYNVPIWLGILHQAGAFVLLGAVVYLMHRLRPAH